MVFLHSDDFGRDIKVDRKLLTLAKKGKISEISVMSNLASKQSLQALSRLQKRMPSLKIGLHLNFVEEKGISHNQQLPSALLFVSRLFTGQIEKSYLKNEVEKQLGILLKNKIRVDSIDSHIHLHAISPISDIVRDIARKYKISRVRSYSNIETFTLKGKINYLVLKIAAILSNLIFNKKFKMPVTWNKNEANLLGIMSWESKRFNLDNRVLNGANIVFVVHPYQRADANRSYYKFLA